MKPSMNRIAVLISNPGEVGDEHYCKGVNKDVEHYTAFLQGAIGGWWGENRFRHLPRPTKAEVTQLLSELKTFDYSLIIFAGHGWYSTKLDATVLVLKAGEEISSTALMGATKKQTLILDCCRKRYPELPFKREAGLIEKAQKPMAKLHPAECRKYYNKELQDCSDGLVALYSCAIEEKSRDSSERGGFYSYSLLRAAERWSEERRCEVDTSKKYVALSVVRAHELATERVIQWSLGQQNPQIEKVRSGRYFPFCIVA